MNQILSGASVFLFDVGVTEPTWTRSRETGPAVELGSATGPSRQSLPQDVPLPKQGAQTTGHAAGAPGCPRRHDAVHWRRRTRLQHTFLFGLITSFAADSQPTAVFLIRAVHTVPVQITPAVQVNTLTTGTGELLR